MDSDKLAGNRSKRILKILKHYRINHLAVYPDIPPQKIKIAREKYLFLDDEIALALYDSTSFGSGNNGIAFGINGLFWNNDSLSENPGTDIVTYEDLGKCDIKLKDTFQVALTLGSTEKIILAYIGEQSKPAKDLERLLYLLKYGLTTLGDVPVEELIEKVEPLIPPSDPCRRYIDILIKILAWVIAAALMLYIILNFILPVVSK